MDCTLKSENWLLSKERSDMCIESQSMKAVNDLKSRVWDLKIVSKIKIFLWRALSGALAVAECFQSHDIQTNLNCSFCDLAIESNSHVLFHYVSTKKVWELSGLPIPLQGFFNSLKENFDYLFGLMMSSSI